jgi:hypothetical protein
MEGFHPDRAANIIHQNIDAAESSDCLVNHALGTLEGAKIHKGGGGLNLVGAQFRGRLVSGFFNPLSYNYLAAFLAETAGNCTTYSLSSAGNNAHFVFQPTRSGCPWVEFIGQLYLRR